MKESKVYSVLNSLNVYDRNRLRKFLQSPYFNVNESLIQLYEVLDGSIKEDSPDPLLPEAVWDSIYPGQSFNNQRFRKLLSDLLKLIEEFLANELYQANPLHKASYLLESISQRQIHKLYNSTINQVRRLSEQQVERPASYYYYQYQIEKSLFDLTSEFERKTKSKSELSDFNISEIAKNLDLFYLSEKMRYLCTLLTWQNITKHNEKILFVDELIRQVEDIDYQTCTPLNVYYQIYLSTTIPNEPKHYKNLKHLILHQLEVFPKEEARDIFEAALNYCIRKVNKGDNSFQDELLELYDYGLSQKILLSNDELSPTSFRNICFIALRLNKYQWTETFIKRYGDHVQEPYRENAIRYNMSRLHFYRKEYKKAMELLRFVEFDDILYGLSSKALLMSTYFELDEMDALHALCDSFSTLLNRKKNFPDTRRQSYKNLIKYVKKMAGIDVRERAKLLKIKKEINNQELLTNKSWLLEKIGELEGVPATATSSI